MVRLLRLALQIALHDGGIIHIKALGTDGLVGLSPVKQCRVALGLSSTLAKHAATFFENDSGFPTVRR